MKNEKVTFLDPKRAKTRTHTAADGSQTTERERVSMFDEAMLRTVATYVLYATAGFLFLPAGRDIVSYKTCILPG